MAYDPGYTKANVSYEANDLLKELAQEKTKATGKRYYVYEVLDEVLREKFPEHFKRIKC